MASNTDLKTQLGAALCGPVFVIGYILFWGILGHNVPPPSLGLSADELISTYFGKYHNDILLGMAGCAVVGILYLPWTAQITVMMRRDEHNMPVLAYIQLLGGGITAWLLAACPAMWAHAAYLGTSNPVMTQAIWQDSWLIYDLTYLITTVQMVAIGVYALTDRTASAPFPAWTGWVAIGGGLCFIPLTALLYYNDGPFALNGLWNFYIVFGWWLVWFSVTSYYMISYILAQISARNVPSTLTHATSAGKA